MCARKLKYAAGDDLQLYATPREAMKQQEEIRLQEARIKELQSRQKNLEHRVVSAPVTTQQNPQAQYMTTSHYAHASASTNQLPKQRPVIANATPPMGGNAVLNKQPVMIPGGIASGRPAPPEFGTGSPVMQKVMRNTPPPAVPPHVSSYSSSSSPRNGIMRTKEISPEDARDMHIANTLFNNHDIKAKGRLTAGELQNLLQNDDSTHFRNSATEALINTFGLSRLGTVNQMEFGTLYKRVKIWRKIYVDNDINGSYTLTVAEFHNSLQELKYLVPYDVSEKIFDQYAEFMGNSSNVKELKFDRFVEALIWLMRLTKVFRKYDANHDGIATVHYKDFIESTLYLGRFLPQ